MTAKKKVEVFKTNVSETMLAESLAARLLRQLPLLDVHFDLEDCDRVLRVEAFVIPEQEIISLMTAQGFTCEVLHD